MSIFLLEGAGWLSILYQSHTTSVSWTMLVLLLHLACLFYAVVGKGQIHRQEILLPFIALTSAYTMKGPALRCCKM